MKYPHPQIIPKQLNGIIHKSPLEQMKQFVKIQGASGNWDYDPYMLGIYNGLELCLSSLEKRNPVFKDPPKVWGFEKEPIHDVLGANGSIQSSEEKIISGTNAESEPVQAPSGGAGGVLPGHKVL